MLLALLSCTPESELAPVVEDSEAEPIVEDSEPPVDSEAEDSTPPEDTSPPEDTGPEVTEETVPDQEPDDSWIFDDGVIHDIVIELPTSSTDGLINDPYTYVTSSITFDGIELDNVGVRIRGKIGSLRPLNGKPKFKLDFNQFVPDQRFYGLEGMSLNAGGVIDCSFVKENLGYQLFRDAGVEASRTSFARVTINGGDYGLYVLIETPDDRFLKRTQEDDSGNLYDGKYVWYGGWSYSLLDFAYGVDHLFQLEEGTDVGNADISAVSTALANHYGQSTFYAELGKVVDWDQFHRFEAVEQWVGQNDGYAMNRNNYRVYFDPEDGKMEFVPWDLDYSFLYDYQWGRSWASPTGSLAYWCMADADCRADRRQASDDLRAIATSSDLVGKHDAMVALIASDIASDTRRACTDASVASEQARVRAWLENGNAAMESFWGF